MWKTCALALTFVPHMAFACADVVCRVDPNTLSLPEVITFSETRSGMGPGFEVSDVLHLPGAQFGERFDGQILLYDGAHDLVQGRAAAPLTVVPGANGQNLSVVFMAGNAVLNGYGVDGFPKRSAQGEGAIAVLFDSDQSAFAFDLRGGEAGSATVLFLRRNGDLMAQVPVTPVGEFSIAFQRQGDIADIAGFVVTNTDPQGLAIDTLRFGRLLGMS